jgi:lipopolysaccharide assembly protein A
MKFFFWFFVLLIALIVALFAVTNRESVPLGLWPFPFIVQAPLYVAILLSLLIGFLAGAIGGWAGGRQHRGESRRRRQRITALERELAATQARLPRSEAPPGTALAIRR